ncbi:MAG: vWA domain-containing protein, partial [Flavisolibacter sp.]
MSKNYLPVLYLISLLLVVFAFSFKPTTGHVPTATKDTTSPYVFKAKDHLGKNVVSKSGVISFTTGLENDYYQLDSVNRSGHFYVEARLSKFLNNKATRIPLNISIVIDRSGSMQGIKLGYAKRAAKNIIEQLNANDIVSVVIYDNDIDTIQGPVHVIDKEKIKSKIDMIVARASTNLWGGTEQGYSFVNRNFGPGFVNRVLLISDGNANVGITDSTLIRIKVQKYKDDKGISLSTFGVGLDYNETLMTDMAETGAGNYYFIDAPNKMTSIFNNELNGLLNVAAQDAELKIIVPKGVTIVKSYPLKYQQDGNEIRVKLRDLSSEETKATLFTYKVDPKAKEALKFTSVLSYTDVTDGQQKTLANENSLTPIKNVDAYLTHYNKKVIEQTILFTSNENLETAMNMMDNGEYDAARKYLNQNKEYLKMNAAYVKGNTDGVLLEMDSLNTRYLTQSQTFNSISADSLKSLKKTMRASSY